MELFYQSSDDQMIKVKIEESGRKGTNLQNFLTKIDADSMKRMRQYLQAQEQVFRRRKQVPAKISLFEDILIICTFKENQLKIMQDRSHIKRICRQLEDRIKRKVDTIKQRICKKLFRLTINDINQFISLGKDISFGKNRMVNHIGNVKENQGNNKQLSDIKEDKLITNQNQSQISVQRSSQNVQLFENKSKRDEKMDNNKTMEIQKNVQVVEEIKKTQWQKPYKANIQFIVNRNSNKIIIHELKQINISQLIEQKIELNLNSQQISKIQNKYRNVQNLEKNQNKDSFEVLKKLTEQLMKIKQNNMISNSFSSQINEANNLISKLTKLTQNLSNTTALEQHEDNTSTVEKNELMPEKKDKLQKQKQIQEQNGAQTKQIQDLYWFNNNNKNYLQFLSGENLTIKWYIEQDTILKDCIQDFITNKKSMQCLRRYKSSQNILERFNFLKIQPSQEILQYLEENLKFKKK